MLECSNSMNSGARAPLHFHFGSCRLNLCCCSEMLKKNRGYVLLQHLQTGMTTSVVKVHFSFLSPHAAFYSWTWCFSKFKSLYSTSVFSFSSLSTPTVLLQTPMPFDLPDVSCVRGQIAAVSHTQYLTQSPELGAPPHPFPLHCCSPYHVSPLFMAGSELSVKVNPTFITRRSLPQSVSICTTSWQARLGLRMNGHDFIHCNWGKKILWLRI